MHSPVKPLYFTLPDGAKLGYNVFGPEHLETHIKLPIILIGGMSSLKIDWERLIGPLTQSRAVMVYDHRGIGDSTFSTHARDDQITIEMMARDLLALIEHLGWKDVDILGFSMGGVILQQLLILPQHPSRPTTLPFRVHHALLTGTMCSAIRFKMPTTQLKSGPVRPGQQLTKDEKKELARPMLDASFGPQWIAQAKNKERYEWWWEQSIVGRPQSTILKQRIALRTFDFCEQLRKLSPSVKVLVIHGENDLIVPFSSGLQILESIPHSRAVTRGPLKGQVPSYEFGHIWFEYFGVDIWKDVIEMFVDDQVVASGGARL